MIEAGKAAAALQGQLGDPYPRQLQRLVQWWRYLVEPLFAGEKFQAVAALSVFAGSFDAEGAAAVAPALTAADLRALAALSVLQDASQSTGAVRSMAASAAKSMCHHFPGTVSSQLLRHA